jgi:hypothetical protein
LVAGKVATVKYVKITAKKHKPRGLAWIKYPTKTGKAVCRYAAKWDNFDRPKKGEAILKSEARSAFINPFPRKDTLTVPTKGI